MNRLYTIVQLDDCYSPDPGRRIADRFGFGEDFRSVIWIVRAFIRQKGSNGILIAV